MSVCLSVYLFFLHNILKTTAARIAELDTEMLHHESWKHFCFDVKRSKVTRHKKQCWLGFLHSCCECRLFLIVCSV